MAALLKQPAIKRLCSSRDTGKIQRITAVLLFLAAAGIAVLSLMPDPPQPEWEIPFLDKIEHFIAYTVLGALAVFSFIRKRGAFFITITAVILCCLFGAVLEWLQLYTGRSTEWADLLADTAGAGVGAVCACRVFTKILAGRIAGE